MKFNLSSINLPRPLTTLLDDIIAMHVVVPSIRYSPYSYIHEVSTGEEGDVKF